MVSILICDPRHGGGPDVKLEYQLIDSVEAAERAGFHGSPTILIDGRDPFVTGGEPVGLTCRVYRTDEGPQGAPTVAEFQRLLSRELLT